MNIVIHSDWKKAVILLLAMAASGCTQRIRLDVPEGSLADSVCILQPAYSNELARLAQEQLAEIFPQATVMGLEKGKDLLAQCLAEKKVLIVPDVKHVPVEFWGPLKEYLNEGGAAVLWGSDPFEARMQRIGRGLASDAFVRAQWGKYAEIIPGVSGVQAWQHVDNKGNSSSAVHKVSDAMLPWPGVSVDVPGDGSRGGLLLTGIARGLLPANLNTMIFYAKGDPGLSHLVVECEDAKSNRWHAVVTVTDQWQPFYLHEAIFRSSDGGVESFDLAQCQKMFIGISARWSPQAPGARAFGLSDVRLVSDGRPVDEAVEWPDIPLVSPPYRHYDTTADKIEFIDAGQQMDTTGLRMQSPLPRATGMGGERGADYRWIPLVRALNDNGDCLGWPASLYVAPGRGGPARQWAWIGVDPSAKDKWVLQKMLRLCVWRLKSSSFLYKAGCAAFVLEGGQRLNATARFFQGLGPPMQIRVVAELMDMRGTIMQRTVLSPTASDQAELRGAVELNLGVMPVTHGGSRDMKIRLALVDREDKQLLDYIEQPIKCMPVPSSKKRSEEEWITTTSSRFTLGKRPIFMLGTAYQPMTTTGLRPGENISSWLDPSIFDPAIVRRDLDRLSDGAINTLSIAYDDEPQAPQLRYVIEEAGSRNMWVNLRLPCLQPHNFNGQKILQLLELLSLTNQSRVFAFDLSGAAQPATQMPRSPFDDAWRNWLVEQYGTVSRAEQLLNHPLWLKKGKIVGPPCNELVESGGHREAIAVYRRFVDDFMSRHYGAVHRFLRQAGYGQLISARVAPDPQKESPAADFFPVDPASGAANLDFISPEGWSFWGGPEQMAEAAFVTIYARGAAGGKPVLWMDVGVPAGSDPQPPDLSNQMRHLQQFYEMAFRSQAAGCIGWWFPAGLRNDGVDAGVVNADATWRPVGEIVRAFAHRLRRERQMPLPWRGRMTDRDASSRGLSALREEWRGPLLSELNESRIEDVRPNGFGKETRSIDILSVGGLPYESPAPLAFVNAEWGSVQVNGQDVPRWTGQAVAAVPQDTLRLELINSGPATWTASEARRSRTVWVRAKNPMGKDSFMEIKPQPFGESAWISWTASDPGEWVFQPWLSDVGVFGEPLRVKVGAGPSSTTNPD